MKRNNLALFVVLMLVFSACDSQNGMESDEAPDTISMSAANNGNNGNSANGSNVLDQINLDLVERDFEVSMAEIYTDPETGQMGTVIFANNRGNKQLSGDFVPDDPRRGNGTEIFNVTDVVDGATASGLSAGETTAAISTAMSTWDGLQCSTIPINDIGGVAIDLGFVQNILGFGGSQALFTDVMHAGWLPAGFFDLLAPGGSGFILGVTFTFIWTDGGDPTDIDGNRKTDVAFREIYYNDAFSWADDGGNFDVETVALHEAGHALSQGHFGKIFGTPANGRIHFSPRAVMNAAYSGVQRDIGRTDNAGHCSNWGAWPNN